MCGALLTGRGEASGLALASEILTRYRSLKDADRAAFFRALADGFGPDPMRVQDAVARWSATGDEASASEIHYATEPRRQELFRRLNRAPGGTAALVAMRADLLECMREDRALAVVDRDFQHLFGSWFNRGFLVLRRIDWSSPAAILAKVIRYEAVHEIRDWEDLRRRIDSVDRRCYAFFHPALVDEPLIFVEVALTLAPPDAIAPLLAEKRAHVAEDKARVATFYSISNCQQGLSSVSFGNFPHQAGGGRNPPGVATNRDLHHALAGPRLSRLGGDHRRSGRGGACRGGARANPGRRLGGQSRERGAGAEDPGAARRLLFSQRPPA